jgi:hypothetical protein
MNSSAGPFKRLFTVEEANAMLPLVRAIVTDLVELSRDVIERQQRLAHLPAAREADPNDPYASETAQFEDELKKDRQRLHGFVKELVDLGVIPESSLEGPLVGVVDFPTRMEGRVTYLSWKLGDAEVLFWRELDAKLLDRQPLPSACAAE